MNMTPPLEEDMDLAHPVVALTPPPPPSTSLSFSSGNCISSDHYWMAETIPPPHDIGEHHQLHEHHEIHDHPEDVEYEELHTPTKQGKKQTMRTNKRNKRSSFPTSVAPGTLPPPLTRRCDVCGDDSDRQHLNYGANACFSCRAFFRYVEYEVNRYPSVHDHMK